MFLYNMKTRKTKKSKKYKKTKTPYYTLGLLSILTALYNITETSPDVTDPDVNEPDLTAYHQDALGGKRKSRKHQTQTR